MESSTRRCLWQSPRPTFHSPPQSVLHAKGASESFAVFHQQRHAAIYSFVVLTLPPPVVLVLPSHFHRSRAACLSKPRFGRPPSPLPPRLPSTGPSQFSARDPAHEEGEILIGSSPLLCALLPASPRSPRRGHRPSLHLLDRQRSRAHTSSSACHPAHRRRCGRRRAPTPSVAVLPAHRPGVHRVAMVWVRR
jgi:hypothetical protein